MDAIKEAWLYESIGRKIKEMRKLKSVNQQDLAIKARLSRTSLVNIEQGKQHVSIHHLWRLAIGLEVDLQSLLPTPIEINNFNNTTKTPPTINNEKANQIRSFIELSQERNQTTQKP